MAVKMQIPEWEQLTADQNDPWQVVPRHDFLIFSFLSNTDFICVGCSQ